VLSAAEPAAFPLLWRKNHKHLLQPRQILAKPGFQRQNLSHLGPLLSHFQTLLLVDWTVDPLSYWFPNSGRVWKTHRLCSTVEYLPGLAQSPDLSALVKSPKNKGKLSLLQNRYRYRTGSVTVPVYVGDRETIETVPVPVHA
jgi:hypothetical protein